MRLNNKNENSTLCICAELLFLDYLFRDRAEKQWHFSGIRNSVHHIY